MRIIKQVCTSGGTDPAGPLACRSAIPPGFGACALHSANLSAACWSH